VLCCCEPDRLGHRLHEPSPCGLREALRQAAFGDTVTLYNGIYGSEQERK